ncbi:TraB/GumN family protein [Pedobacter frigiditerrae]|uniref:TraB/GumN family protein n=1 Tax=Pedobacter frigiditerrae TaxID=2530452 RepID=UPI00292F6830|nr:TraB/GumN family protein [Pedobacter frigiditerrae]
MKFSSLNRFLLKIYVFSFLFFAFLSKSYAQQPTKYSLLWEISGNGLKKPSYLFGSMHLKDKRIFNFSDSVIKAMDSSSAFVMEVHPDSVNKSYFDESKEKVVKRDVLKLLSSAQIDTLMKRFKAKNGFEADSATLNNPILISALMKPDYAKPDDMPSFVDAYLYGIARTLKKKIFGLEKIEDQMELLYEDDEDILALFDDNEQQKEYVEEMIAVYARGNINEIYDFLKDEEGVEDADNSIARNLVMANGMKELFKNETVFTVVGAAHLPGDKGLIALLKKDGYKVRPVTSTFTGVAKNYQIDYAKMDWYHHIDPTYNYNIDFPSLPARKFQKGTSAVTVYSDISTETIFTATASFTGPITAANAESYLDTVAKTYAESEAVEIISQKKIVKDGIAALELEAKTKSKFVRTIIQYNNSQFFTVSVEGPKNNLHDYFGNHFLESFHSTKPVAVSADNWITHKNEAGAFSVKMPLKPEELKKEVANPNFPDYPYQINMYLATDQVRLINYILRYNDFPTGLYLANLPVVFESLTKPFEGKAEIISGPTKIFKDGYEGRSVEMVMQGYHMEAQMFVRGNRTYMLLKQNLNGEQKPEEDPFFKSFKFENYIASPTIPFSVGNLKVQMPSKPLTMPSEDEDEGEIQNTKLYYAVNNNTGGVYGLQSAKISKYARYKSLDTLYKTLLDGLKGETDSLIKIEDILIGSIKAKQYTAKDTLAGTEKKLRIWIDKDQFYFQTTLTSKEEILGKQSIDFFNNINYTPHPSTINLFSSKADLIMADLKSKDTTTFKAAFKALNYYGFEKDELPIIYKALRLTYDDDTIGYGVRGRLIGKLKELKNETTIPFLKELYQAKNPDVIRAKILGSIPAIDSTNYDWYLKKLIETPPLKIKDYWGLFRPLNDSLSFAGKHLNELIPLMNDEGYRTQILTIVSQMLGDDNKALYQDLINTNKEKIVAKAISDIDEYISKPSDYPSNVYSYLNILTKLALKPLADEFTKKVFKLDSSIYMHTTALATRIKLNLPLDIKMLSEQLDSLSTRYEIMQAYKTAGRLKEVPLKYRKHDEFGKLMVYNYANEEDYYPQEIKLLGKIKEGDKTYYAYEVSFDEDGEVKKYLAIAGAFNDKSEDLDFENLFGFLGDDELEEDWETQAKALIETYNSEQ